MPKSMLKEARFDFRGGRVSSIAPDLLNVNELVDATNAKLTSLYGGFTKRSGTQRIHQTALGAAVKGVTQWDGPSGKQVVAIANGHLFYRNGFTFSTALTDEGTNVFSTSVPSFFMPFRDTSSGAPLVLFIASGGKYFKWTGTVLTDITGTTTAADRLLAYHTRPFARNTNFKKQVFWGKIGDATSFATGDKTQGGSATVDVLSGEELIAFEVIGSSLIIAAEDSTMRFTGQDATDIVISQDTEGISSEVGVVGPLALRRYENVAGMLSERGPYAVTEQYVEPIGEQIIADFDALDIANLPNSVVGWNRGTKDLLFAVPGSGDSGLNKTVYAQAVRLQAWQGPWTYPFGITYLARYEDSAGDEHAIAGCSDGFIRHMNIGSKDDVLYDGSSGSNITMTVEPAPLEFGNPGVQKAVNMMKLEAQIPSSSNLSVEMATDGGSFNAGAFVNATFDNVLRDYRIDIGETGRRHRLRFVDSSAAAPIVHGFTIDAYNMLRP